MNCLLILGFIANRYLLHIVLTILSPQHDDFIHFGWASILQTDAEESSFSWDVCVKFKADAWHCPSSTQSNAAAGAGLLRYQMTRKPSLGRRALAMTLNRGQRGLAKLESGKAKTCVILQPAKAGITVTSARIVNRTIPVTRHRCSHSQRYLAQLTVCLILQSILQRCGKDSGKN